MKKEHDLIALYLIIKKNKKNNIKITPGNVLPDYIPNTYNGAYYG